MRRIAVLCLVSSIAACSTTAPPPTAPPAAAPAVRAPLAVLPAATPPKASPVAQAESPLQVFDQKRDTLANVSVFFPYDSASIASDQYSALDEHANLESAYSGDHVVVQGNCDERGGREYNLALGQRRAEAVKERLAMLGVPEARIEAISYGKEKPRATCHQEKCWAQDRRVDFVESWQ